MANSGVKMVAEVFPKFIYNVYSGADATPDEPAADSFESIRNDEAFVAARGLIESSFRRNGHIFWQSLFLTRRNYTQIELAALGPVAVIGTKLLPENKVVYPSILMLVYTEELKAGVVDVLRSMVSKMINERVAELSSNIAHTAPVPSLVIASQFPETRGRALRTAEWAYNAASVRIIDELRRRGQIQTIGESESE